MKKLANGITVSRLAVSVLLLTVNVFSMSFYLLYTYCGLSDMVDGVIARKLNAESKAGAVLDSVADMVFVIICLIKILPAVELKLWLWVWTSMIALVRIINFASGYMRCGSPVFLHTTANKVTGLFLFLLPMGMQWMSMEIPTAIVCAVATFAAVQELHFICTGQLEIT